MAAPRLLRASAFSLATLAIGVAVAWPTVAWAQAPGPAPDAAPPAPVQPTAQPAATPSPAQTATVTSDSPPTTTAPTTAAAPAPAPPVGNAPAPVLVAATGTAAAPTAAKAKPVRDGFMLGGSFNFGVGAASGYPNDVRLDKNPDYYGSTPMLPGFGFNLFVMGAIAPYLNVGFFGAYAAFGNSDWSSIGGGGGLRLETYPLFWVCPCAIPKAITENLGIYGQFGLGSVSTNVTRPGNYETIGGVQSMLAAGVFHEFKPTRWFALGPDLRYEVIASRTSDRNSLMLGLRIALYPGN